MKKNVALIGIGEMGGVFARAFLKDGHPVFPVIRDIPLGEAHKEVPDPEAVVVSVRENDLEPTLKAIDPSWHDRLVLLQNELLPKDWKGLGIESPTVISVWFEKKPGQDHKVIIPSPVYGPNAEMIHSALSSLNIACRVLKDEAELLFELVLKNIYILTSNISGLKVGGTVGELWKDHQQLARDVANDVMDIQFKLIGQELDREKLIDEMVKAFDGDPDHKCMGRSAPARLERAIAQADEAGLKIKHLRSILALK